MLALQFHMKLTKLIKSYVRGLINSSGYWKKGGMLSIDQVPFPTLVSDDWVVVKTVYCGICGSDMKEVSLDGARDNPLQSFISFPHIIGHEVVGIIDEVGPKVERVKIGDRVVINPWFSCEPRGITPLCPRCQKGDITHCSNFQRGQLPIGMHLGVTRGFGGYAPYVAVHQSQCFVIPEKISFEQAVLADPFAVAFHSCLLLNPEPNQLILVYGLGVVGLLTLMCLKNVFNIKHVVGVGRYDFQKEIALRLDAKHIFMSKGSKLVEEVASYTNAELLTPDRGSKWALDGVDGIIDTIGSADSLEAGIRFLTTRGKLVFTGVSTPRRCENTPHYFKELEIIGSCGASIEEFQGKRASAFQFFLDFCAEKIIDPAFMLTHKFSLEQYQRAFDTLAGKLNSKAIKVAFDFTKN